MRCGAVEIGKRGQKVKAIMTRNRYSADGRWGIEQVHVYQGPEGCVRGIVSNVLQISAKKRT